MKPATAIGVVVFALVSIMHGLRLLLQTEVVIGGHVVPMWISPVGFVAAAVLAIAMWREAGPGYRLGAR